MAMFNSYVKLPEGVQPFLWPKACNGGPPGPVDGPTSKAFLRLSCIDRAGTRNEQTCCLVIPKYPKHKMGNPHCIYIYNNIYILLYIYIQCGLPILCLGYLGITRQHVCSFLVPALSIHDRRRKAFEVGPSTGPGGPPLHALGHRNGCTPSGNLT